MRQEEKNKILKLVGMLGSNFDNERSVAAKKISEIAINEKFSIIELMQKCFETTVSNKSQNNDYVKKTNIEKTIKKIKELKEMLFKYDDKILSVWERQFTADVIDRYDYSWETCDSDIYGLSEKQLTIVNRILSKYELRYGTKK